jgi:ankyrin repeat protein
MRRNDTIDAISAAVRENSLSKLLSIVKQPSFPDEGRTILSSVNYKIPVFSDDAIRIPHFPHTALSLMHVAAFYDSLECFLYLFSRGLSLEIPSAAEFRPIHYAAAGGGSEIASFLCEHASSSIHRAPPGEFADCTPIWLAVQSHSYEIVRVLLESGVDVMGGRSSPLTAAIRKCNIPIISLLLEHNSPLSSADERHYSPMMRAIVQGLTSVVPIMLEADADPNYMTPEGKSALHLACTQNMAETVRLLLDYGADPTIPGFNAQTGIHWAAASGNVDIIRMVVAAGADPHVLDIKGRPGWASAFPLLSEKKDEREMTLKRRFEVFKYLLRDLKLSPNIRLNDGVLPVATLFIDPDPEGIKLFLDCGLDLTMKVRGMTLWQLAHDVSSPETRAILKDYAQSHPELSLPNIPDPNG